jgi:hypothetical protein
MFPHERSLVEKYQGRPFALLGVNLDVDPAILLRVQEKERLNWRSWFDGQGGPIAREWGVTALPTLYLIDHKGIIRYESEGVPPTDELEKKIEALVKEVEQVQ